MAKGICHHHQLKSISDVIRINLFRKRVDWSKVSHTCCSPIRSRISQPARINSSQTCQNCLKISRKLWATKDMSIHHQLKSTTDLQRGFSITLRVREGKPSWTASVLHPIWMSHPSSVALGEDKLSCTVRSHNEGSVPYHLWVTRVPATRKYLTHNSDMFFNM